MDQSAPTFQAARNVEGVDLDAMAGTCAINDQLAKLERRSGVTKRSVSLSMETAASVDKIVGPRQFSAYVERALQRQLQRDHLADVLEQMEAEVGPVDEAEVSRIEALLRR